MKKLLLLAIAITCIMSCGTTKSSQSVKYAEAHGYFVRNDAPPHAACYYDNDEAFDSVFGCAAVMGKDGMPTMIDFKRQSVIAVIGGETNRPTEYHPVSLMAKADTLYLKYSVKEAVPSTYTMVPVLLLIIDKPKIKPNVKLERQP